MIGTDVDGSESRGEIVADLTSSFMVLLAIYFPSVTGTAFFNDLFCCLWEREVASGSEDTTSDSAANRLNLFHALNFVNSHRWMMNGMKC